jgi:hypothetical protein
MDEIFELKKQKDVMDRELGQKDSQLFDAKTELECAVQIIEVEV